MPQLRQVVLGALAVCVLLAWCAPAQADIPGDYRVYGTNPDGSTYSGKATIERENEVYVIVWEIRDDTFGGIGIVQDNVFSVVWVREDAEMYGIVAYTIEDDQLSGTWTMNDHTDVYTETLTPR